MGLPIVRGLIVLFIAVRIDWVELEEVWEWDQFADGRRFTLGGVIDQLGDDEGSRHANTETQGSGSQRGRVLVGEEARGGRGGLCKEKIYWGNVSRELFCLTCVILGPAGGYHEI